MPSPRTLEPHYRRIISGNVSVSTAQAALRILRDRGLVEGHQGRGTYVAGPSEMP
ncbi:GntR family transcriptional regulator [Micromonospora sp. WMMD1120]|nr:GntR family transcriptional regulator [Micromonospora sp. WMMD1120]MDG4806504.1 GntR family transcriptional regulator [Micromonospora sp. WMMD1120]